MFRYLAIIALVSAYSSAEYLYGNNPYNYVTEYASAYDNYKPKDYKFEYGVSDPHTGDHKSQWEVMENGIVRGAYSLLEPDGTTRIVEYYADDTGFHADVKKIGTPIHPPTPLIQHAPLYNAAHGSTYGYGDIAQFTGYGTSGLAVNYAHTPALSHQIVSIPQEKVVVEQPHIAIPQPVLLPHKDIQIELPQQIYQKEPQIQLPIAPKILYHEQPRFIINTEQHQLPIQYQAPAYNLQPSVHAQAFAKVLLDKQPLQYAKQVQYDVPPNYDIPQVVKYIPEHINYELPQVKYAVPQQHHQQQQIKYEAPIAIKIPQQKNVVIYENQVPQHQYVNYAQEVPRYYEKPLPYGYDNAGLQYSQGSY